MEMITACIPKRLRCRPITARALAKGRSRNKVRELVAFEIVRAVKKFDVANG